jgi:hypothetical protein
MKKTAINIHHTAMYSDNEMAEQFDAVNEAPTQIFKTLGITMEDFIGSSPDTPDIEQSET